MIKPILKVLDSENEFKSFFQHIIMHHTVLAYLGELEIGRVGCWAPIGETRYISVI